MRDMVEICEFVNNVHKFANQDGFLIGHYVRPIMKGNLTIERDSWAYLKIMSIYQRYINNKKMLALINQKTFHGIYFGGSGEYKDKPNGSYVYSKWSYETLPANIDVAELILEDAKDHVFCRQFMRNFDNGFEWLLELGLDEEMLRLLREADYQLLNSIIDDIPKEDYAVISHLKKEIKNGRRNKFL